MSQRLERLTRGRMAPWENLFGQKSRATLLCTQAYRVLPKKRPAFHFSSSKQEKSTATRSNPSRIEFHLVVAMKQGWFEFHGATPEREYDSMQENAAALLSTLQLNEPALPNIFVKHELESAAPVIGNWKAISSKLELRTDGSIIMQFDRKKAYRLDSTAT